MRKRRKYYKQAPPFNVTVELTMGCNLSCHFCAVSAIQDKPGKDYKFMAPDILATVVRQIADLKWNCRIGFAMRGEPTMHPDYIGMVGIVRKHLPKAHITMLTNAGGLLRKPGPRDNVMGLFEKGGLNVLGLDNYDGVGYVPKVLSSLAGNYDMVSGFEHPLGFTFYEYPKDIRGNPHIRRPRNSRTLVSIRDIAAQDSERKIGNHGKIFNYAGLSYAPDDSMEGKRCHHPFRQFVVHWDGNVPLCCNLWTSPYHVGNVMETPIDALWNSDALGAAREMLIQGRRKDIPSCKGCNHRSYRVGLLPDLYGKDRLHRPDEQTKADIAVAMEQGNHTPLIRVPWEERLKQL
jgi:radical SAM protein with 4Fe4S-binding SPASM domain